MSDETPVIAQAGATSYVTDDPIHDPPPGEEELDQLRRVIDRWWADTGRATLLGELHQHVLTSALVATGWRKDDLLGRIAHERSEVTR